MIVAFALTVGTLAMFGHASSAFVGPPVARSDMKHTHKCFATEAECKAFADNGPQSAQWGKCVPEAGLGFCTHPTVVDRGQSGFFPNFGIYPPLFIRRRIEQRFLDRMVKALTRVLGEDGSGIGDFLRSGTGGQ